MAMQASREDLRYEIEYQLDGISQPMVVVRLSGEIDVDNVFALREVLDCAFEQGLRLAVDMAGVRYLSAAGVSVLILVAARARGAGGGFSMHRPQTLVRRIVSVLGLEDELAVDDA